jgi:hypothetical protein
LVKLKFGNKLYLLVEDDPAPADAAVADVTTAMQALSPMSRKQKRQYFIPVNQ